MFLHKHPYEPFLFEGVEKLIVGTLPPPRFSTGKLKPDDVHFCYGSKDGQLWKILDLIFDLNLIYKNSPEAISQRKNFLKSRKIGVCDIVSQAFRQKVDASDLGMQQVQLRELFLVLQNFPSIHTLLFTGGNSKNGPEYFFRKLCLKHDVRFEVVDSEVPRIHRFIHPVTRNVVQTISLTAPSGAANRAVGSLKNYKEEKAKNPGYSTFDFRVDQYRNFF